MGLTSSKNIYVGQARRALQPLNSIMFVTQSFGVLSFQIDSNRIAATTQNLELRITLYFKVNKIHTLCVTYCLL